MKYKIISAPTADHLADEVSKAIAAGWQPQGGVCARIGSPPNTPRGYGERGGFLQAIVLKEPNDS
jgi:Domain of unknown function (DUF1737)